MLVNFVDTGWYIFTMTALCLILLVLIFFLYKSLKDIRMLRETGRKRGRTEKYKDDIARLKNQKDWLIIGMFFIIALLTIGGFKHFEYAIEDEFAWSYQERKSINDSTFEIIERTKDEETELYEQRLHVDWYDDVFESENASITQSVLDGYEKNVKNIYRIVPQQENTIRKSDNDNIIEMKKSDFEEIVSSDNSMLTSEELWNGFLLGEDVIKIYYTSENVFQMAVLAESAHDHAIQDNQDINTSIVYSAGSNEKFEKFLKFSNRNAGDEVEVSEDHVCFRVGKMLYCDSQGYNDENEMMAKHCGVYSYSCFRLSEEMVDSNDSDYLLYLYYRGLGCINILPFIEDESLCNDICSEELKKWEKLEENIGEDYIYRYNVENKSAEKIFEVRDMLKIYAEK